MKKIFILFALFLLNSNTIFSTTYTGSQGTIIFNGDLNTYSAYHDINISGSPWIKIKITIDIKCKVDPGNYTYSDAYAYINDQIGNSLDPWLYSEDGNPETAHFVDSAYFKSPVWLDFGFGTEDEVSNCTIKVEYSTPEVVPLQTGESWQVSEYLGKLNFTNKDANGNFLLANSITFQKNENEPISIRGSQTNGTTRLRTDYGYLDLGPNNNSWCHIQSGQRFYFNQDITVGTGVFCSYSTQNLVLKTNTTQRMTILNSNGNVGIGTTNPTAKLEVSGGDSKFDSNYKLYIPTAGTTYFWKGTDGIDNTKLSVWDKFTIYNPTTAGLNTNNADWNIRFGARDGSIESKGKATLNNIETNFLGIGTTTIPNGYKLAVNGKIIAEEVVIKLNSAWPDFVFGDDYNLPSLGELEAFVKTHNHLPGIPSADKVSEQGVELAEMNRLLLQKIEELTLYLIQQQKEIEVLKLQMEER